MALAHQGDQGARDVAVDLDRLAPDRIELGDHATDAVAAGSVLDALAQPLTREKLSSPSGFRTATATTTTPTSATPLQTT